MAERRPAAAAAAAGISTPLDRRSARRPRYGEAGAARARLDAARRAGREPDGQRAASSPAAARRSPTASCSAASSSTSADAARRRRAATCDRVGTIPGQAAIVEAGQRSTRSSGTSVPRIDIPAKVTGTYTYVQNVRVPGMLHGRRVRPRGAGANTVENDYAGQRRPELDRPHPGRPGRPDRQLPRRRRAEGVRRDPGGGAAEGGLEDGDPRFPATSGNFWSWLRQAGDTNTQSTRPATRRRHGRRPGGARVGGEDGLGDLPLPLQQLHADRPALRGRRRERPNGGDRLRPGAVADGPAGEPRRRDRHRPGVTPPQNRFASSGTRARARSAAARPARSNEEAALISAKLGKPVRVQWMRWDQHGWDSYGPAQHVRRHDGRRRERQHRRGRLDDLRPAAAATIDDDQELLGTVTWPAVPGTGGIRRRRDSAIYGNTGRTRTAT